MTRVQACPTGSSPLSSLFVVVLSLFLHSPSSPHHPCPWTERSGLLRRKRPRPSACSATSPTSSTTRTALCELVARWWRLNAQATTRLSTRLSAPSPRCTAATTQRRCAAILTVLSGKTTSSLATISKQKPFLKPIQDNHSRKPSLGNY